MVYAISSHQNCYFPHLWIRSQMNLRKWIQWIHSMNHYWIHLGHYHRGRVCLDADVALPSHHLCVIYVLKDQVLHDRVTGQLSHEAVVNKSRGSA